MRTAKEVALAAAQALDAKKGIDLRLLRVGKALPLRIGSVILIHRVITLSFFYHYTMPRAKCKAFRAPRIDRTRRFC